MVNQLVVRLVQSLVATLADYLEFQLVDPKVVQKVFHWDSQLVDLKGYHLGYSLVDPMVQMLATLMENKLMAFQLDELA